MKKLLLLFLVFSITIQSNAQAKGVKIGYIDMEYILEKVPDYKEASIQLDQKAQKWKLDIEVKKNDITKLKEALKNEKTLLTKELIEEREEEIKFLETEMMDYQQKRFGPNGDLIIQKASIVKPIQDQVFNAVQDIAEAKGYDFIFDKSSDLTMLFSHKRHNLSDRVVTVITRSEKREEMGKKQRKALEEKEEKEDQVADNEGLAERKKILDEKKAARNKILEDRKLAAETKRNDFNDRKAKLLAEQKAKKEGTSVATDSLKVNTMVNDNLKKLEATKAVQDSIRIKKETERLKTIENNKKTIEERKKALEEKRKKILADREAAKKAKVQKN